MSDFVIITDSAADLTAELAAQAGVEVLPLSFTFGAETYQNWPDCRDMSYDEFYRRLRAGEVATTSAVNVSQYLELMEPLLQAGKDVLILGFSSALSATYQSATVAVEELREKYPQRKLITVDTLCACVGQGLLVWLAAQRQAAGESIESVRDWVEANKISVCHQVTVDDLHFLKRGGRISSTTAVVGTMLSIKPVLYVDDTGHLLNVAKARGRQGALKALVDRMGEVLLDPAHQTVFLGHADCAQDAQVVADMIRQRWNIQDIKIATIGPVIGAHTGPGAVALCHLGRHR